MAADISQGCYEILKYSDEAFGRNKILKSAEVLTSMVSRTYENFKVI
jgi:hypothetical protein